MSMAKRILAAAILTLVCFANVCMAQTNGETQRRLSDVEQKVRHTQGRLSNVEKKLGAHERTLKDLSVPKKRIHYERFALR